jgi:hypothetical protein
MATLACAEGVDQVTLAALLNHQGTRHVGRYTHVLPARLVAVRGQQRAMLARYMSESAKTEESDETTIER